MTNLTTRTNEAIANLNDDLIGYATRAAMQELQTSWQAALNDGAKPAELIADIDLVIAQLQRTRKTIGT